MSRPPSLQLLLLLVLLVHLGSAMHPSRVAVHIPADLHNPKGEEHAHAHFGFGWTNYKGSISAYVYMIESHGQLCTGLDFGKNGTTAYPSLYGPEKGVPFIIMTNASDWCSPVTQTRHAQSLGAAAMILAYDGCPCGGPEKTNCTAAADSRHCVGDDYLVNDGSGGDVTIPTFLVYKPLSDQLHDRMKNKQQKVLMELTWGLDMKKEDLKEEEPYKLHLWSSARDPLMSLEIYQHLQTLTKAFGTAAPFEPRFTVVNGTVFGCREGTDDNVTVGPCKDMCTNHGRYCALSSEDGVTGQVILKETVRRKCIWKHFGVSNADHYWEYLMHHTESCNEPHLYDESGCITKGYKKAKIPDKEHKTIEDCMEDTGDLDKDVENTLLQASLDQQKRSGIVQSPVVTLGEHFQITTVGWTYSIFQGLCEHFWSRESVVDVPKICFKCGTCSNIMGCIKDGHCVGIKPEKRGSADGGKKKKKRRRRWLIFFSIVVVVGLGAFLYKKRQEQADGFGGGVGMLNGYFRVDGGGAS